MLSRLPRSWLRRVLTKLRPNAQSSLRVNITSAEQFAGFINDPRAQGRFSSLRLSVDPWFAVRPDWVGRIGPISGVVSFVAKLDHAGKKGEVLIQLAAPMRGFDLVRAAFPLFYPTRPSTGWGGNRVAVTPGAPIDMCWNAGGGLRPLYEQPKKQRFAGFETAVEADGERWLGEHAPPVALRERTPAPPVLIDPKVHRPLERRQPSDATYSARARIEGQRLLVEGNGSVLIDAPAESSLGATHLRTLEFVSDIDVAAIGTGLTASRRVAELAAYSAILHDAQPGLQLDPGLTALVCSPFAKSSFLNHMNRSLGQVRAVMHHHTRALTQGAHPAISVIVSCQRPTLLVQILEQVAAQDYPSVEVVIGCHGFAAPPRESFSQKVQSVLGPILAFEADTIFGDVLARLSAASSGDFISKMDDDDLYGPSHLSDLYAAWVYSEAQLVGKKLALVHFEETDTLAVRSFFLEGYRWQVAGGASIISRGDLTAVGGWRSQTRAVDRGLSTRLDDSGGLSYACSGPGYVHTRHSQGHTWTVSDRYFLENFTVETVAGIPPAALGVM
ncbi:MAG: glycosyltransferase [Propionicimonas sp.]